MEQRDLLKRQIEEMGRFFAKLGAMIVGGRRSGEAIRTVKIANQQIGDELKIDIQQLVGIGEESARNYLKGLNLSSEGLTALAGYLGIAGNNLIDSDADSSASYLQSADWIAKFRDDERGEISLSRIR